MDPTEALPCPTSLGLTAKAVHDILDSRATTLGQQIFPWLTSQRPPDVDQAPSAVLLEARRREEEAVVRRVPATKAKGKHRLES